jgi:hypothetical protein
LGGRTTVGWNDHLLFPARLEINSIVNPPALHAGGTEKSPLVFIPKPSSAFGKVLTDDIGQD